MKKILLVIIWIIGIIVTAIPVVVGYLLPSEISWDIIMTMDKMDIPLFYQQWCLIPHAFRNYLVVGVLPLLLLLIGVPVAYSIKKRAKAKNKRTEELQMIEFYQECVRNEVYEYNTEIEKKKVAIILQKYDLPKTNISSLFTEAKRLSENTSMHA